MATITFDGKTYQVEDLNDVARTNYNAIRFADDKLQDLKRDLEIFKTAAGAYSTAIAAQLPEPAHPNKKKGVITVNGKKYDVESFSEQAKQHIILLNETDRRIEKTKVEVATVETARHAYVQNLQRQLQTLAA